MDQLKFKKIRATFPWTEHIQPTKSGGVVQIIDCNGQEVPLFVATSFLEMITKKLAVEQADTQEDKHDE